MPRKNWTVEELHEIDRLRREGKRWQHIGG